LDTSVFFPLLWDWGLGPFELEKIATKQEIWEISFYITDSGSNHASFLGVLEITDNLGQSFLSYNISFSFLFSFFL
jgi:hypothetical protein